jgi:hypothetical protein
MSTCWLDLFVEPVLVGTSLVFNDSINGVKDLLIGFGIAGAITVENFIPDNGEWHTAHVLIQEFAKILHKTFIVFVIPNFEGVDIDFVFGFGR